MNGTPPASQSAIDECNDVKITQRHLDLDTECTICMTKWQLDDTAKELPCLHVFHEDCIKTWLNLHGVCPICRYELKTNSNTYERYKKSKTES